ncbi:hypothetical protein [Oceanobacillus bengalensis]|uniref:Uncharacterized protein n=1 Tax=Oceanobacillus bengalensis TaxID=1435466 RepID=A0A494YTC1_9BACI|nr:hypothetical protein [Oceanobacillus bengalensis]RKQ13373.1 hypothetical protein D8M05_16535 [Oceanobacillus bengalensis]
MAEKKVYILLTDTGSLLTKLIKLYTKKAYNHASISFDSELSEVYSFGRKKINNPFNGGFVKEDVTNGLFKQADCAIYSFTVTAEEMGRMRRYVMGMEENKESYRYNFLGLFGFLLNKPIKRKNAFFCSEFVASVLKESNRIHFEKSTALIAPNDFEDITNFQFVYEGKVKAYHNKDVSEEMAVPTHFIPVGM